MYLQKIDLHNIRSISHFTMEFDTDKCAGWHVLLGENGSGKTSILRCISLGLIGPAEILRLDPNWKAWLKQQQNSATIELKILKQHIDARSSRGATRGGTDHISTISAKLKLAQDAETITLTDQSGSSKSSPDKYFWGTGYGWFSAGIGAYRRFTGGNNTLEQFYIRNPRIGAHLSLFKEDAALTESVVWLKDLYIRSTNNADYRNALNAIRLLVNQGTLLPPNFSFEEVNVDGAFFRTPDQSCVPLYELSEGIKSILSLTFELLRLLMHTYHIGNTFENFNTPLNTTTKANTITLPGIVLIDEIDAHLHPTWQSRIGQWFTQTFPNIQFIVATHSPLICRGCATPNGDIKGTIWKLPQAGSTETAHQITGKDKDLLIFGDILDAYETKAFGNNISQGEASKLKQEQYRQLMYKVNYGIALSPNEQTAFAHLKNIFHTHVEADQ